MTGKIILLVDDNKNDVFLAERALKKNNIASDVVVAGDGQEAWDFDQLRGSQTIRTLLAGFK